MQSIGAREINFFRYFCLQSAIKISLIQIYLIHLNFLDIDIVINLFCNFCSETFLNVFRDRIWYMNI